MIGNIQETVWKLEHLYADQSKLGEKELLLETLDIDVNTYEEILSLRNQGAKNICNAFLKNLYFSCYDCCNENEPHAYCPDCMKPEKHQNHVVLFAITNGGSCDCGDTQILKEESFCEKHSPNNKALLNPNIGGLFLYYIGKYIKSLYQKLSFVNQDISYRKIEEIIDYPPNFLQNLQKAQTILNDNELNQLIEFYKEKLLYYQEVTKKIDLIYLRIILVLKAITEENVPLSLLTSKILQEVIDKDIQKVVQLHHIHQRSIQISTQPQVCSCSILELFIKYYSFLSSAINHDDDFVDKILINIRLDQTVKYLQQKYIHKQVIQLPVLSKLILQNFIHLYSSRQKIKFITYDNNTVTLSYYIYFQIKIKQIYLL